MAWTPFAAVSDYPGMLNKIASWTFIVSLGATVTVRHRWPELDAYLGRFAFKIPVAGVELQLGTLAPPFALALISRITKLHDRLSDAIGIRRRFDREKILLPLAAASGATLTVDQLAKIDSQRQNLMGSVFYPYVSSNPSKSKIDSHYVTMALDQWSWYWVVLEALFVIAVTGCVLCALKDYRLGGLAGFVVVVGIAVLQWLRNSCGRYAAAEIREILKVEGAQQTIRGAFNAL